ncbi:MAG TPA: hypothetical protein VNV66_14345, partial [Pilimelia sp.]|nr:hypothetical protein [Pilimelia sp.]
FVGPGSSGGPVSGGPGSSGGPVSGGPGWPGEPGAPGPAGRSGLGSGPDGPAHRRRLLVFGGVAGAIVAAGLAVVLAVTLGGGDEPFRARPKAAVDVRPPLARLCPPPTVTAAPEPSAPRPGPAPSGPRTVDRRTGISYRAYGEPWRPWDRVWRAGTLEVAYGVGQYFVTERYSGGQYLASILSGSVPAADNDGLQLNLECVGRQVAADVRAEYYPQPNRMQLLRDERTVLGGRPAWVTIFRLHFRQDGLEATSELAGVACIDVGRPDAAVLYVSIPDTHRQFDRVVDEVLASVRVA